MRKTVHVALTVMLLACVTSGVSLFAAGSGESGSASASKSSTVSIAIWNQASAPGLQLVADAFTQKNPNIKIDIQVTPWVQYWEKMQTGAAGGSLADIVWMNGPNIGLYAKGNVLMPLDDRIKKDKIDMGNYPSSMVDLYRINGIQYAMPKDFDVIVLWYNKALFKEAGIPFPDKTWTWDRMVEAAAKLTNKGKGIYGLPALFYNQATYYNTIAQCGGFVISADKKKSGFSDPNTLRGVQCWIDLIKKGISPTLQQMTDTSPDQMFMSGKMAMIYEGSWMAIEYMKSAQKDNIDLAVLPQMDKRATIIHGLGYGVWKNTKQPEEVWKFMRYLVGKEANDIIGKDGSCLPAFTSSQKYVLGAFPKINMQACFDQLDYAVKYPVSLNTAKWQQVEADYLKLAYDGTMSTEEACKIIATKVEEVLAAEK